MFQHRNPRCEYSLEVKGKLWTRETIRGWLLRIVTNTSYDLLRKSKRHPLQPLFIENEDGEYMGTAAWLVDPNAPVQHRVEKMKPLKRHTR